MYSTYYATIIAINRACQGINVKKKHFVVCLTVQIMIRCKLQINFTYHASLMPYCQCLKGVLSVYRQILNSNLAYILDMIAQNLSLTSCKNHIHSCDVHYIASTVRASVNKSTDVAI